MGHVPVTTFNFETDNNIGVANSRGSHRNICRYKHSLSLEKRSDFFTQRCWLSSRNFFRGQYLLLCKFLLIC